MRRMLMQRASENRMSSAPLQKRVISVSGTLTAMVSRMPAVTDSEVTSLFFSALVLVIMRETVIGIPAEVIVINNPRTDSEIW